MGIRSRPTTRLTTKPRPAWMPKPIGFSASEATAIIPSPSGYGSRIVPMGVPPEAVSTSHSSITLKFEPGNAFGPGKFGWTSLSMTKIKPNEIDKAMGAGGVDYDVGLGLVEDRPGYNPDKPLNSLQEWIDGDRCSGYALALEAHFQKVVTVNADGSVTINDFTCRRLVICPVVTNLALHTNERIVGFAWFFIDGTSTSESDKKKPKDTITGRFLRPLNPDDPIGWGDYDPYGAVGPPKLDQ